MPQPRPQARLLRRGLSIAALLCSTAAALRAESAPDSPFFVYTDPVPVSSTSDGGLPLAVGVHAIQVIRSNRTHPELNGGLSDTYRHQPMLAWWKGKFYLEFLSCPVGEEQGEGRTSLTTSVDGVHWAAPRVIFPPFALPNGTMSLTHQRMGFYTAPDGRLLVLAFYGKAPKPNDGTGIGRAVREIHEDGTLGPIYFIRFNAKQPFPGFRPPYPFFTDSPDAGFVAACRALLADKLKTAQWWEEDQLDDSGFYRVRGKALSYARRPDGSVLGMFKDALVSVTRDNGRTWAVKQFGVNLPSNASKYGVERTGDGRYAVFLNPTNRLRYPLAVMTGADCIHFSNLLTVVGETPPRRFEGAFKNLGPQYVRVIAEGNGVPPGSAHATWIAFSMNKEDIWVARVPVPITGVVNGPVHDTFEQDPVGSLPSGWNVYSPLWAPVRVVETPGATGTVNHALELKDRDPYDYARAIRVFPRTHGLHLAFRVLAKQASGRLEIELSDDHDNRPLLIAFGKDGHLWTRPEGVWTDNGPYPVGRWISFSYDLSANPRIDRGHLLIDGHLAIPKAIGPVEAAPTVDRLSFRTGRRRLCAVGGPDLPGADDKVAASAFLIDDVSIVPVPAPAP